MAGRFPSDPTLRNTDLFEFYRDGRRFDIDWQDLEANVSTASDSTPKTLQENGNGVNVVDTSYIPGDVRRYGADPTGASDSTSAFQAAEDSGYIVRVTWGNWRVDGTVVIDKGSVWWFDRGILPNYRWHANPNQVFWDRTAAGCRLFKDNTSSDVPFFKIRSGWVNLLGHPLLDVGLRDSFTSDGVLYDMVGPNALVLQTSQFAYPRVWGGRIEVQALGNSATISDAGEGMHVIRVDWGTAPIDDTLDDGYTTKLKWDVKAQLVDIAAEIGPRVDTNQWSNSGFIHVETHGAKRSVRNEGTNQVVVSGYHQCDDILDTTERGNPVVYLGASTRDNVLAFRYHDLGSNQAANGNYRNDISLEDHAWRTVELSSEAVLEEVPEVGLIVRNQRTTYDNSGLGSVVDTYKDNIFANLSLKAAHEGGTFQWGVYAGDEVESSTAVSDCVFANQSGNEIDIQSAGGNLPTWAVGAIFSVADHDAESDNNADFQVVTVNTVNQDYTIEKIQNEGYLFPPVNASSEAVTINEDIGSLLTDSTTAGITQRTDGVEFTETAGSDMTQIGHSWSDDWMNLQFDAAAVTNKDYLEIYWDGWNHAVQKVVSSFIYRGRFDKIQYIGLNSGAVVNNVVVTQAAIAGNTAAPPHVIEMPQNRSQVLSGSTVDAGIYRFWYPDSADENFSITDLAGIGVTPLAQGHVVTQKGGHTLFGNLTWSGGGWDEAHVVLGTYHLWVDSTGDLRINNGAPTSDTDGTVVGTQT